jgi:hypothetical protein
MNNRRKMLRVPKTSAREKKRSTFKTISFLESIPENEQGAGFSDPQVVKDGDYAQGTNPKGRRIIYGQH